MIAIALDPWQVDLDDAFLVQQARYIIHINHQRSVLSLMGDCCSPL